MADSRPSPDALLARVNQEERAAGRGRLKIFLGANAGVGKTYAMLTEAHERRREGIDVVIGYVETHKRSDTEALLDGLEVLPRRAIAYRGIELPEFDLDAALQRHPQLVIVDELAHTNAPESRHQKRWQDVDELLQSGIDVYSAVNVQHVETLNDLVAKITGVVVRETVPDSMIAAANEVELVDIPPDDLLKRLAEGKVYLPEQARKAATGFFTRANLTALRQLALRHVADRVDRQMEVYRRSSGGAETWPVAERILVGVGPAPSSRRLVRATRRMAERLGAEWIALFVETPASAGWSDADRSRVWETLAFAEKLGGRTATVGGPEAAREILEYARGHNVSKLVIGKPAHRRWRDRVFGSPVEAMIRESGDIDVYVIRGDPDEEEMPRPAAAIARPGRRMHYLLAIAAVTLATGLGSLIFGRVEPTNVAMVFMLAVVLVSMRLGRGPSAVSAVLSVLAFDFFFVPPYLTFAISDTQYLITLAVLLIVGLLISTLTFRLKQQIESARHREKRTAALQELAEMLARTADVEEVLEIASRQIRELFGTQVVICLPDSSGTLQVSGIAEAGLDAKETGVAQWVFANGRVAGASTTTLPGSKGLYLPLSASLGTVGVLGLIGTEAALFAEPERLHFIESFATQLAGALERAKLAKQSNEARQREELSRLKHEFLSIASNELHAPLAKVEEDISGLLRRVGGQLDDANTSVLATSQDELVKLRRLLDSLLDLSRLESGKVSVEAAPVDLNILIRAAADRFDDAAEKRGAEISVEVSPHLPKVAADATRIEAVLANLVTNALRHTSDGGLVELSADHVGDFVQVSVSDTGAGVSLEDQPAIFDKFVQLQRGGEEGGSGLGLAIAWETIKAHGGTIWVDSGPGPGSVFSFTLPVVARSRGSTPSVDASINLTH